LFVFPVAHYPIAAILADSERHPITGSTQRLLSQSYREYLVLRSDADLAKYGDAVEAFAHGGSRRELMMRMMAIGMTAAEIRWHPDGPGRRMLAIVGE
jgi:hypothetical protein